MCDEKKSREELLKELRIYKRRYQKSQIIGKTGFMELNIKTGDLYCSEGVKKIYGIDSNTKPTIEFIKNLIHPDDFEKVENSLNLAIKGEKLHKIDHRMIRFDNGKTVWVQALTEIMYDENGNPELLLGSVVDISVRKEREMKLIESENRFNNFFNTATDNLSIVDKDLNFIRMNHPEEFGYSNESIVGVNAIEISPKIKETGRYSKYLDVIKTGKNFETTEKIELKDQTLRYFHIRAFKLPEGLGLMSTDVTETYKLQDELIHAKKKAEAANEAKTQFLANMSHEIRTPLGAIIGFTELLNTNTKNRELSKKNKKYIESINIAGHNLTKIVNNILDLTRIEAGKIKFHSENIEIERLIRNVYRLNLKKSKEKKVKISYNIDDNVPKFIISDNTLLTQVLLNLVGNAVKFTEKGNFIELNVSYLTPEKLLFKIKDNGIGIPEDKIDSIFERFEQVDNTDTRAYGGAGLGLSICKRIVEFLKGKIWIESKLYEGSTFYFEIPFKNPNKYYQFNGDKLEKTEFMSNGKLILIIDDDPLHREMIKELIAQRGFNCEFAINGKEGIEKSFLVKPDLILMDMQMPIIDGLMATEEIRKIPECKDIPIFAFTADALDYQRKKAFTLGINEYLTKPLNFQIFNSLLGKYLPK